MEFRLILCDLYRAMTDAWAKEFADCSGVETHQGDMMQVAADAYVSPANSYGDMGGGLDFVVRERFGRPIEARVQAAIRATGGPLPVGQALVVETQDPHVPYLIVAPTMREPTIVAHTRNAYEAMLALLRAAREFNREHPEAITSIAIPGLGTGVGRMPLDRAAQQMREAYDAFLAEL
jgi:O-acetyl-ADP-ribose deacetylase (regulator of RNase III)